MTLLHFPQDRIVGTLLWRGLSSGQAVLATGGVEVPDDQGIHLRVSEEAGPATDIGGGRYRRLTRPADLSFLQELPGDAVERLSLSWGIVPETFAAVATLAPGLTALTLGFTELDDRALPFVAQLVNLTNLQTFGNTFTDAGIQQLASLGRMKDLSLEEETLTIAGFDFVTTLPDLISLDVWDVQMTGDEHAQLQARLPGVELGNFGHGP